MCVCDVTTLSDTRTHALTTQSFRSKSNCSLLRTSDNTFYVCVWRNYVTNNIIACYNTRTNVLTTQRFRSKRRLCTRTRLSDRALIIFHPWKKEKNEAWVKSVQKLTPKTVRGSPIFSSNVYHKQETTKEKERDINHQKKRKKKEKHESNQHRHNTSVRREYLSLWAGFRALLKEYRAILVECRALLAEYTKNSDSLTNEHRLPTE